MRIFISYRRLDAIAHAERFFFYFTARFGKGRVFWDHASIPEDQDWEEVIHRDIEAADVVIALIGPQWLSILQEREAEPKDHVRIELEYARKCGKQVVVVPIDDTTMPDEDDLPESLRFLTQQQSPHFDGTDYQVSLEKLEQRLLKFAPIHTADRFETLSAKTSWSWFLPRTMDNELPAGWWDLWNLHAPESRQQLADIFAGESSQLGVVLLAGRENSGRRYLVDAAVSRLRQQGHAIQLLRINLDGYEVDSPHRLWDYLFCQAQRLSISTAGLEQLHHGLASELGEGLNAINTCAAVGMLLDLTRSFSKTRQIIQRLTRSSGRTESARLVTWLLDHLNLTGRTIIHVEESIVPLTLREDLLEFATFTEQIIPVFSVSPHEDPRLLQKFARGRQYVRIELETFLQCDIAEWLAPRCDGEIPTWLPKLLWEGSRGNPGLIAWQLLQLLQQDVLQWTEEGLWRDNVTGQAEAAALSKLLSPLSRLFSQAERLEELLRLAALCGELFPFELLCQFLRIPPDEQEQLIDLIDDNLVDGDFPMLEDAGFNHPGLQSERRILAYRFSTPLYAELILRGTNSAWREEHATQLLNFLEQELPANTRTIAEIYLRLHHFLPADSAAAELWTDKLKWWISEQEGERLREHIAQGINSGNLDSRSVWNAIQSGGGSPTQCRNLLLGYESQKEGIPAEQLGVYYNIKGLQLLHLAEFSEAEFYLRESLRMAESDHGPEDPNVARVLNNLAGLLRDTNRLAEAEPMLRRALAIDEQSYGENHPNVVYTLNNLAGLLQDTNRLAEAEPLMRRALAIDEQSYGKNHPSVAICLNNLAQLLLATNRLAEAEPMLRRALAIDEQSYGENHPRVANALNNLAQLLLATNRLAEAEPMMRRALAINEQSYGENHPKVAKFLNNLAQLLQDTNRLAEAEPMMRRALAIDEQSYGENHPSVARDLNNLAQLLKATNRLAEAEQLMRRALAIDEQSYGKNHPSVAICLNNLARLLHDTKRLADAEPMIRRALAINEQSYGENHPEVATALYNLAQLLQDTNRLAEAEPLMRREVTIYLKFTQATGHPHPHLQDSVRNYQALLQELGHNDVEVRQELDGLLAQYGLALGYRQQ